MRDIYKVYWLSKPKNKPGQTKEDAAKVIEVTEAVKKAMPEFATERAADLFNDLLTALFSTPDSDNFNSFGINIDTDNGSETVEGIFSRFSEVIYPAMLQMSKTEFIQQLFRSNLTSFSSDIPDRIRKARKNAFCFSDEVLEKIYDVLIDIYQHKENYVDRYSEKYYFDSDGIDRFLNQSGFFSEENAASLTNGIKYFMIDSGNTDKEVDIPNLSCHYLKTFAFDPEKNKYIVEFDESLARYSAINDRPPAPKPKGDSEPVGGKLIARYLVMVPSYLYNFFNEINAVFLNGTESAFKHFLQVNEDEPEVSSVDSVMTTISKGTFAIIGNLLGKGTADDDTDISDLYLEEEDVQNLFDLSGAKTFSSFDELMDACIYLGLECPYIYNHYGDYIARLLDDDEMTKYAPHVRPFRFCTPDSWDGEATYEIDAPTQYTDDVDTSAPSIGEQQLTNMAMSVLEKILKLDVSETITTVEKLEEFANLHGYTLGGK